MRRRAKSLILETTLFQGRTALILTIEDDFDLARIADSGQCFRWEQIGANTWRILHATHCVCVTALGNQQYDFDCDETEFAAVWRDYFDLQTDYRAIRARIDPARDPFLYEAAAHQKGIRILRQDPWEMLITFIISQNKNIPAIRKSVNRLTETCGEPMTDRQGRAYYAFPTPEAIAALPDTSLRACALGYRCAYVKAAAQAVLDGKLDLEQLKTADEEITISALTSVHGVGVKVANCVSLFGLHHMDAFPRDVWINRVLEREYPNGFPFETYRPYNGLFQQYLFAHYRAVASEPETPAALPVRSRAEFRAWLKDNAASAQECWVCVRRGRPTDDQSFWYLDAVEEALCFGWIDSTTAKTEDGFLQRFTPRKKNSPWTELNKERVRRLERLGLMTDLGRAVLPPMGPRSFRIDPDVAAALKAARVWSKFRSFPPLYQRVRAYNVAFYKTRNPAAYDKALRHLIESTRAGKLFGEWNDYGRLLED